MRKNHQSCFQLQEREDLFYKTLLAPLDDFDGEVRRFIAHGGSGLNVTVPFKENAYRLANELTARAKRAEAVNTLKKMPDGTLLADNTDGAGLVRDLMINHSVILEGKRILILGAGGAVRGVLHPLLELNSQLGYVHTETSILWEKSLWWILAYSKCFGDFDHLLVY